MRRNNGDYVNTLFFHFHPVVFASIGGSCVCQLLRWLQYAAFLKYPFFAYEFSELGLCGKLVAHICVGLVQFLDAHEFSCLILLAMGMSLYLSQFSLSRY